MNSGKAKRFLGWILAVAMVVSILPTAAFAEGEEDSTTINLTVDESRTITVDGLYETSDITVSPANIVTVTSEQDITTPAAVASRGDKLTPTADSVTGVISDGNGNYMKWTKTLATGSTSHYAIDSTTELSEATVWTFKKQTDKETYLISYTDNSNDNSTIYYMSTGTGTVKLFTYTTEPSTGWTCSADGGLVRNLQESSGKRTIVYNNGWGIIDTTAGDDDTLAYLYSVIPATEAEGTTDITVTGVAAGTATLTVDGNTYTITVKESTADPEPDIDTSNPASQTDKPDDGDTTTQPFISNTTGGSQYFRIPAIVTLKDGTLVAAADARWDTTADGGGLDTIVARSTDDGKNWSYTFANYLGDNGNEHNTSSTAFIDPALATDGETVYMVVDLFPAGYALNGATTQPIAGANGFTEDGYLRLSNNNRSSYGYYLKDGKIYSNDGTVVEGYAVDDHFNIFGTDENGDEVNTNLFCADSPYLVYPTNYLYLTSSADKGATWSAPTLINAKNASEQTYLVGPGGGTVTSTGRIIFPCYTFTGADGNTSVIYSDDGGATWTRSANVTPQTSEATVSEVTVNDGQNYLYMFTRHGGYYVSTDNGTTWSAQQTVSGISYYTGCELSTLTYSKLIDGRPAILLSAPTSNRTTGKIFVGLVQDDSSIIWKYTYEVNGSGTYQYSDLTELSDGTGTIGLLYEDSGSSITYTTLSLDTIAPNATIGEIDPDDPNAPKTETVNLTVGKSKTYTIEGKNYQSSYTGSGLDTSVATVTVTGKDGTTATKATSITANSSYAISDGSGNYLSLDSSGNVTNVTDPAAATQWKVESTNYTGTYYLSATVGSTTYYLCYSSSNGVSVTTDKRYWYYTSGNGFYTYTSGTGSTTTYYYLYCNDGSWTFSTNSTSLSNLAQPYTVTTSTDTPSTSVEITGVASGKTYVTVGNTTYNITVTAAAVGSDDSVSIEVPVSQTVTVGVAGSYNGSSTSGTNRHANVSWTSSNTTTPVTAIVSGTYVLQNTKSSRYLTNTLGTYEQSNKTYNGLAQDSTTGTEWTITQVDGGYYIQDNTGKYLSIGSMSAEVTSTPTLLQLVYDTGNSVWTIGTSSGTAYYLNSLGDTGTTAGGWTAGVSDNGSRWKLYPASGTTTITVTGVTATTTPITVPLGSGDNSIECQITVLDSEITYTDVDVFIHVGDTVTYDNNNATGFTVEGFDSNIANVSFAGGTVTITGVSAGHTTATLGATRYNITVLRHVKIVDLKVGETTTDTISGADYSNAVSSDNSSVATVTAEYVDGNTVVTIEALTEGAAVVIVGDTEYIINVTDPDSGSTSFTVISDTGSTNGAKGKEVTKLTISEGISYKLKVQDNSSVDVTDVEWSLIDENNVVSITTDSDGSVTVTGVGSGEAYLVATVDGVSHIIPVQVLVNSDYYNDSDTTYNYFFDLYISEIANSKVAYSFNLDHNLLYAQEGQAIYVGFDNPFCINFFGMQNDGYVLTFMGATNSANQFYSLYKPEDGVTNLDAYNKGAMYNQRTKTGAWTAAEVEAMLQLAVDEGYNGTMGWTRAGTDASSIISTLSFRSQKLLTVDKTVAGVLGDTSDAATYRPYEEGMTAKTGEWVYFAVTVTIPQLVDSGSGVVAIQYSNVTLTDDMGTDRTAYFVIGSDDVNFDSMKSQIMDSNGDLLPGVITQPGRATDVTNYLIPTSLNITTYITNTLQESGGAVTIYVAYKAVVTDVGYELTNQVELAFGYKSTYSEGAFDEKVDAQAVIDIVDFQPENAVIDFGLPVTFDFSTDHGTYNLQNGTAAYGTVAVDNNVVTYTPTQPLPEDGDLVYLYNTEGGYTTFHIYPASNMLYEETFLTAGSGWTHTAGSAGSQSAPSDKDRDGNTYVYGYDPYYASSTECSDSSYYSVTLSESAKTSKSLTTTFYGNGFDLIGDSGPNTAALLLIFHDLDGKGGSKVVIVDTRLDDTSLGTLHQVPMGHISLTESTYKVSIYASYIKANDVHTTAGTKSVIDGFRVYRDAENANYGTEEQNVSYVNILEAVDGNIAAFMEGGGDEGATYTADNYESSGGPQSEIYLSNDQSIALNTVANTAIQVSARAVTGTGTTLTVNNSANSSSQTIAIDSNTEMYYRITSGGVTTLTNSGDGMLALAFLKVPAPSADAAALMLLSDEDMITAYSLLSALAVTETAPAEAVTPAETETAPAETETTPAETETAAEPAIVEYTFEEFTELAETDTEIMSIPASELYEVAATTIETAPAETKTFEPDTLTLDTDSYVLDGQKYATLTVTASTDVDTLTINGVAVWASNLTEVLMGEEKLYRYSYLVTAKPGETVTFTIVVTDKYGRTSTYTVKG